MEKIPKIVAHRLALYHRCLRNLYENGERLISSYELGKFLDLKPSQVRKDLSYFGAFGVRGKGYDVKYLLETIENILGVSKPWRMVLIGAGNLGRAILNYEELRKCGFEIIGVFDNDPKKIGEQFAGHVIRSVEELEDFVKKSGVNIGVIAVPPKSAQKVADLLVSCGVRYLINFSPIKLKLPPGVLVEDVDISIPFKVLTFKILESEEMRI